jgi:hypothetical protein
MPPRPGHLAHRRLRADELKQGGRRSPRAVHCGGVEQAWDYPGPPAPKTCDHRVRVEGG